MSSELSKQEYLKRYIEGDDKGKKRKRKANTVKTILPKVKIVHEDVDISSIKFGSKEEIDEEECPVVAEVVDERPIEIKSKELYESSRWKRLGEEQFDSDEIIHKKAAELAPSLKNKKSLPNSSVRHDSDSDLSPARHHQLDRDPPLSRKLPSLPREKRSNSEKENHCSKREGQHKVGQKHKNKQQRHDSDSDLSPTRQELPRVMRTNSDSDLSPARPNRGVKSSNANSDSDLSPARPNRREKSSHMNSDSDLPTDRKGKRKFSSFKNEDDSDLSPPRKTTLSSNVESVLKDSRPVKTLSGLKAGLQNATTLRHKTKELKKREKSRIEELDDELSGRNAGTVVRDKRTGKKRNLVDEARLDDEKEKELAEQQQKYDKWGKGLIQGDSKNQKLAEDLYETSKPLARYCDDEDLEEKLKAVIRDDDPMAQYMRKKKQKHAVNVYPLYRGPPPPPNRFSILPGYRWDSVDRSNGFEKRYFERKSNKKAMEEEAYLWSVQDM